MAYIPCICLINLYPYLVYRIHLCGVIGLELMRCRVCRRAWWPDLILTWSLDYYLAIYIIYSKQVTHVPYVLAHKAVHPLEVCDFILEHDAGLGWWRRWQAVIVRTSVLHTWVVHGTGRTHDYYLSLLCSEWRRFWDVINTIYLIINCELFYYYF